MIIILQNYHDQTSIQIISKHIQRKETVCTIIWKQKKNLIKQFSGKKNKNFNITELEGAWPNSMCAGLQITPSEWLLSTGTGQGTAMHPWVKHFTVTVPLFTQMYKWVLNARGGNPAID